MYIKLRFKFQIPLVPTPTSGPGKPEVGKVCRRKIGKTLMTFSVAQKDRIMWRKSATSILGTVSLKAVRLTTQRCWWWGGWVFTVSPYGFIQYFIHSKRLVNVRNEFLYTKCSKHCWNKLGNIFTCTVQYKEIQRASGAMSCMRKCFLVYMHWCKEMCEYIVIDKKIR
jgi:hypothetical protein